MEVLGVTLGAQGDDPKMTEKMNFQVLKATVTVPVLGILMRWLWQLDRPSRVRRRWSRECRLPSEAIPGAEEG